MYTTLFLIESARITFIGRKITQSEGLFNQDSSWHVLIIKVLSGLLLFGYAYVTLFLELVNLWKNPKYANMRPISTFTTPAPK